MECRFDYNLKYRFGKATQKKIENFPEFLYKQKKDGYNDNSQKIRKILILP